MIIAVDGPAASGKGTLARRLASHYGFAYLDTGALYRAVARDVRAANRNLRDEAAAEEAARNLDAETLKDPFLLPMVREALRDYQRSFARRKPGAVLDGRDIGTVVCPDADVKLYVTAGLEERARRRFHELRAKNFEVTRAEILEQIRKRDERDKGRDASPLTRAPDAYLLDTTDLDIEAAFKSAVELIDEIIDS